MQQQELSSVSAVPDSFFLSSGTLAPAITFTSLLRLAFWEMSGAVATAILSAALSIAPFWFIYQIATELFRPEPDETRIWSLALFSLVFFLLRWLLMAFSHILAHKGAFTLIYRLRLALARHLARVPLSFFASRGAGALRRTINDDTGGLEGFYAHMLPDTIAAATIPVVALIFLVFADWRLGLAAVIPLPLALFAQWWWMGRTMGERMKQWETLQKVIANQVGEYIRAMAVIKSFGLDARSFGDLERSVRGAIAWVGDYARTSTGGFVVFSGLLRSSLVLIAPLGACFYVQGSLDLPTYILFLLISPLVLEPLLRLMFSLHELLHKIKAMERINNILQAEILKQPQGLMSAAGRAKPTSSMDIDFINVSHHYDERHALKNVTFRAKAGRLTAIVGSSGSGKSTLLRLVARLYEIDSHDDTDGGHVQLGGVDVRDWPLDDLLAQLAIVFQEVFLFSGTVRDNLKLARDRATDVEIETAAIRAQAHDFICALPQGYDTVLEEGGRSLSGGERQRISIARAFLKDAPVLLLDEALASLDGENEYLIRQTLDHLRQNRTVLMICHNLRNAMAADHIIVMQGGEVVAQGCHEELLRDCSFYQHLWHDHRRAHNWHISENGGDIS